MADALTGLTEVAATVQDLVSAEVQMVLNANVVVPGTINEKMAPKGCDLIKIPRIGKFTVAAKVENVAVDAQVNAAATDDLPLDQHKVVQFLVEDIAGTQAAFDVMGEYIRQAGIDLAVEMDQALINTLEGASSSNPDHLVAYAGAALASADVLTAKKLLGLQNVPTDGRTMLIDPTSESALLANSLFVGVDQSGSAEALRNGKIGRIYGFDVFVSSQVEAAKSLFYHKSAAVVGRQILPKVEYFRDVANLADRWSISHLYGSKILDGGKRVVLMGTAS